MQKEAIEKNGVVEINSDSAETVFLEQELLYGSELDEAGVINVFSQAIWGFFEDNRRSFAGRLGVDELDAVLADARILSVESGKTRIYKPEELLGLSGPVKIRAYATVVKRNALPDEARAVIEPGAAAARLVLKKGGKAVLLVDSGEESSSVYLASDASVKKIERWGWGRKNILEKMREKLLTDNEVNNEIYLRYIKGEAGESVSQAVESIFLEAFKDFEKGLAAALYNNRNTLDSYPRLPVFVKSGFPLPEKIYKKRIAYDGRRFGLKPAGDGLTVADLFAEEEAGLSEELSKTVLQRIKWLMV